MKHITAFKHRISRPWHWFKKTSLVKKILTIVIVLVLLFIGTSPLRPAKPSFTVEKVVRGTVSDIVSESGNVAASSDVSVFSPSTGYISTIYVKNGDSVSLGQNLFEVTSTATPDEKAQAFAAFAQAKTAVDAANATAFTLRSTMYTNWKKFTDLATNSTYENGDQTPNIDHRTAAEFQEAQDNWFAAEANYKNQQNVVVQAQAALASASLTYQATQNRTVTAPLAGTIANFSAHVGDQVSAAAPGTAPVLLVGNFSSYVVKLPLNEVDVNKITVGETATLVFDAMRDQTFHGTLETIDTVGTNAAGVITYTAVVRITDADTHIRPNMTVTVAIETAKHENVLIVPNSAIKPYKGGKAVLVPGAGNGSAKNAQFHYVPVSVGLKGITDTEITNGVSEGMHVITAGITTAQLNATNGK